MVGDLKYGRTIPHYHFKTLAKFTEIVSFYCPKGLVPEHILHLLKNNGVELVSMKL